jgi:transcription initiation factor TFIID subunit 5
VSYATHHLTHNRITSVEFSPDASLIAAGSAESTIRLWSLKDEKLKAKSVGE